MKSIPINPDSLTWGRKGRLGINLSERDRTALKLALLDGEQLALTGSTPRLMVSPKAESDDQPKRRHRRKTIPTEAPDEGLAGFKPGDRVSEADPPEGKEPLRGVVDRIENGRVWVSWDVGTLTPWTPESLILTEAGF